MEIINIILIILGFVFTFLGLYYVISWYGYWKKNYKGKLLTEGPYATVRHPYYLGFLLLVTGLGVLVQIFETVTLAILSWILIIFYVRKEENELIKRYGKKYKDYSDKVRWRLIPRIY